MDRNSELERKIETLVDKTVALERENKILREEVASLRKGLFGRSSERIASDQLSLFLTGEFQPAQVPDSLVNSANSPALPPAQKKKGHGRRNFAPELPRQVIESDLPDAERICPCCGKTMVSIGEDVSERGHVDNLKL